MRSAGQQREARLYHGKGYHLSEPAAGCPSHIVPGNLSKALCFLSLPLLTAAGQQQHAVKLTSLQESKILICHDGCGHAGCRDADIQNRRCP